MSDQNISTSDLRGLIPKKRLLFPRTRANTRNLIRVHMFRSVLHAVLIVTKLSKSAGTSRRKFKMQEMCTIINFKHIVFSSYF